MKGFLATLKGKIIVGIIGALAVAGIAITIVALTSQEDVYRSIKVDELTGQTIILDENNNTQNAYEGMNLEPGDMIEVKEGSYMTLLMDADKYMFADAGTKFKVEASGNSEKATTKTKIILIEGSVLCRLDSKLSDDEIFEVETPNSVMSVRGTIFRAAINISMNGDINTITDVLEGAVDLRSNIKSYGDSNAGGIVGAGQTGSIKNNIMNCYNSSEVNGYGNYSKPMAEYVVDIIDSGREIAVPKNEFVHQTGLLVHPETEKVIKEPTCSEEGQKEIYCETCKKVLRTETIEITEHTPGEWEAGTEGTCSEKATEVKKCTKCGEILETRELEYADHSYGDWKVTTEATCTKKGEETRICSGCDKTETRELEMINHSYGDWKVTTEAGCEKTGVETRTCSGCDAKETKTIASKGHSYGEWKVTTKATCTEAGKETRTCSGCKKTETQSIAATGHSYGDWNVTTEATCETAGEQIHSCGVCGQSETQTIDALGHDYPAHTASDWHNFDGCDREAGTVDVFSYRNCTRCGLEDTYRETATMTEYNEQYQQPTGFTCPCGYVY